MIKLVNEKTGPKKDGTTWTSYGILSEDGQWYNTFSTRIANLAKDYKGRNVTLWATQDEYGFKAHDIRPIE